MVNRKILHFKCIRCGNCCLDKNTLVNLTYNDILRIKEGLKLSIDELLEIVGFYVFNKNPDEEELKKMVVPPLDTERGLAFVALKKNSQGACIFYDNENEKCKIYGLRPNFCRTFPFSFRILTDTQEGERNIELFYTQKAKEYCQGIKNDAPPIEEKEWKNVGKKTIEDLADNNILIERWNEAVEKKVIEKSAKNFIQTLLNLKDEQN